MLKQTLILVLSLHLIGSTLFALPQTGNWDQLSKHVDDEVAVKVRKRGMVYGVLKSHNSTEIEVDRVKNAGILKIRREDVRKTWTADLNSNKRNTAKGALIGAAVGSVAVGVPSVVEDSSDPLAGAGFFIGAAGGALVGGIIGAFSKKKHRKMELVYKK